MIDWAQRAHVAFSKAQEGAPKTPITYLSGVVGVTFPASCAKDQGVSGVSGVDTQPTTDEATVVADLLDAAMRRCADFGDGEAAQAEMRADCLDLPLHLQIELLQHFRSDLAQTSVWHTNSVTLARDA